MNFDNEKNTILLFPNPQELSLSIRASALVFEDPESKKLHDLIVRVAPSNATALIMGETGTGKELVARHIHNLSPRKKGPFAAINCGAFSENLVESELFGHERGAFTGAVSSKAGWFETANGGTLFLDEIGDLPQSTQVKLLRVLQEREIVKIGSRKATPIDVRLIAATNVNLEDAVKAGRFREDLFYRINVVPVQLAPLRDRRGDILPLVAHFISTYKDRLHTAAPLLTKETQDLLINYAWPGNIRELENVIHRALLVCDGNILKPRDLNLPMVEIPNQPISSNSTNHISPCTLEKATLELINQNPPELYNLILRTFIVTTFNHCNQNQVQASKVLGISRNILRRHLKDFGLIQ